MFERFTERARQVVVLAQEEARALRHNYIGTEHILLGLVRENEGVAARVLLDFNANAEKIRNEVIRMLGGPRLRHLASSEPMAAPDDQFPAAMDDVLAAGIDADLGWRGRPMALAALGAAVLARTA
jgi:ATP-dependent Clp protease ATP-binding subunit ClpA